MCLEFISIVILCCAFNTHSLPIEETTDGYQLVPYMARSSLYKYHDTPSSWSGAKLACEEEGASLFYPRDSSENGVLSYFRNKHRSTFPHCVPVGIRQSLFTNKTFVTVDGLFIPHVHTSKWRNNDPDDIDGHESCVCLLEDGWLWTDVACAPSLTFVCRKPSGIQDVWDAAETVTYASTTERTNEATTQRTILQTEDYESVSEISTAFKYKLHLNPATWNEARLTCENEGATLFYPNSKSEIEEIVEFYRNKQNKFYPPEIFVGIAKTKIGFMTVDGIHIPSSYNLWENDEPNNASGDEDCIEMYLIDKLAMNDVKCDIKMEYICKKLVLNDEDEY